MMSSSLKTTPLHGWHKAAGANMADFGGYEMPLWYDTGVKQEHLGVLKSAGIFDTSHMACIDVWGQDAFGLLNLCFTRDITTLAAGRCVYGAFLNAKGHCIDDAIVYKFSDTGFMVCVNAGMGAAIAAHLKSNKADLTVDITDCTDKVAKMDIQGKNSARILSSLIRNPDKVFDRMPYFSFKGNLNENRYKTSQVRLKDGTPVLLSRSGYTGEFGFEIFVHPDAIVSLWENILLAGAAYGITACGLGARDSLRAGACLPLSHQDIGGWPFIRHPWDFALPFAEDKKGFTKAFIGAEALLEADHTRYIYAFAGDSLRKVAAGDTTQVLDQEGNNIGRVLTCATDMGITWHEGGIVSINSENLPPDLKIKGISCGFIMVSQQLDQGDRLTLLEGKRKITATIVSDIRPDRTARRKLDYFL
jgi:aminomethyltransferase